MATRSASPNPSRPASNNPLLRTPESSSSIRRSGESFKLSKSSITAESPQRNSGCLRASFEQKENERELNCSKTPRAKSPIVSSSKGVKNFMAPTISAASKVIAASPRKKILGERNEVISVFDSLELPTRGEVLMKIEMGSGVRTVRNEVMSASYSLELPTKEEILQKPEMGSGCQTTPDIVSNVLSAGVGDEEIEMKSEAGSGFLDNLDYPVIKSHRPVAIPTSTPNPALSPLDADPSSQPYDPESNYLSPRPQFLRYKPNPRFEHYRNKEGEVLDVVGGGKQLEDSFSSESYEEAADSSEEAQSEPEEEESCLAVEDTELEDRTRVSESELEVKPSGNHPKSRSFIWYKVIPLLLLVLVGCLYVPISDSPVLSSSSSLILKKFDGLATRFRDWSTATVAYLTTKASPPKELGTFNLVNLTFSSLDQTVGSDFIFSTKKTETDWHFRHEMEKKSQMEVSECNNENHEELEEIHPVYHVEEYTIEDDISEEVEEKVREMEYKAVPENVREEVHHVENNDEEEYGKELEEVEEITGEEHKAVEYYKAVPEDVKESEEVEEITGEEHKAVEYYKAVPEDAKAVVHPVENETELMNVDCAKELEQERRSPSSYDNVQNVEEAITGGEHKEVEYNAVPGDLTEKVHPVENDMESKSEERILFKHIEEEIREMQTSHCGPESVGDQDIQIQSVGSGDSLLDSPEEYQIHKGLDSRELSDLHSHMLSVRSMLGVSLAAIVLAAALVFIRMKQNQATMVVQKVFPSKEMESVSGSSENYNDGKGSCEPAELSSSLHSTPYSGQQKDSRRLRRDSEASSSISYGSFTTYERVSAKKGCRDDEVVTPVRRSSRIRNLVTSP